MKNAPTVSTPAAASAASGVDACPRPHDPTLPADPSAPSLVVGATGGHGQIGRAESQESTRDRVARALLEHGPQTVAALAERLHLTAAGIRRHLDVLLADGMVAAGEEPRRGPRGRGRPAKVFRLTDDGRDHFHQAYDDLAASALRYIRDSLGDEALTRFAQTLVAGVEERYRSLGSAGREGTTALAEALNADGYAASVQPARHGEQLCQHHCPVAHVAEQFPQLCEAETEMFSRLLGRHVQRLATIAHGDGVCTTHVPDPAVRAGAAPAARPDAGRTTRPRTPTTRHARTGRTTS